MVRTGSPRLPYSTARRRPHPPCLSEYVFLHRVAPLARPHCHDALSSNNQAYSFQSAEESSVSGKPYTLWGKLEFTAVFTEFPHHQTSLTMTSRLGFCYWPAKTSIDVTLDLRLIRATFPTFSTGSVALTDQCHLKH
ncbi:hypothetical protein R5R35_004832 [Gryllus longicercus]|uniref:Uncharacterized protein n=1 Tax=Gryllus longicercus TaxID=2509291 RepID=A0AAN9Z822_9ORTH